MNPREKLISIWPETRIRHRSIRCQEGPGPKMALSQARPGGWSWSHRNSRQLTELGSRRQPPDAAPHVLVLWSGSSLPAPACKGGVYAPSRAMWCDVMICTSRHWDGKTWAFVASPILTLRDAVTWPHAIVEADPAGVVVVVVVVLQSQPGSSQLNAASVRSGRAGGWISHGAATARGSAGEEEEGSAGCWGSRRPGSTSSGDASSCSSATMTDLIDLMLLCSSSFLAVDWV